MDETAIQALMDDWIDSTGCLPESTDFVFDFDPVDSHGQDTAKELHENHTPEDLSKKISRLQERIDALERLVGQPKGDNPDTLFQRTERLLQEIIEDQELTHNAMTSVGEEVLRQKTCLDIIHTWCSDVTSVIQGLRDKDPATIQPISPLEMPKARGGKTETTSRWSRALHNTS
ncbi:hypothetical protein MMC13_001811 [Lambiella insularis]|nr:hypothetical protein [Lambiella insularis]